MKSYTAQGAGMGTQLLRTGAIVIVLGTVICAGALILATEAVYKRGKDWWFEFFGEGENY